MTKRLLDHERHAILFLLRHMMYGTVGGFTFGALVLFFDIGQLRSLAFESSHPIGVIILFFFGLFVTFGSLGMGVGIMGLGNHSDDR